MQMQLHSWYCSLLELLLLSISIIIIVIIVMFITDLPDFLQ